MNSTVAPYLSDQLERRRGERRSAERRGSGGQRRPEAFLTMLAQTPSCRIADGEIDIRSWAVKTAAGFGDRAIGTVEDLVVDLETRKVRYIAVSLDKDAVATTRNRLILVPVGIGRVDESKDEVRLDGFTTAQLVAVPEVRPDKLSRHYETTVCRCFAEPSLGDGRSRRDRDFYEGAEFDDRNFWGTRRAGRDAESYIVCAD